MLRKFLLAFIVIVFSTMIHAQNVDETGIKFEKSSWQEILTKAQNENKIIFLDAFASWCGPCKWMAKNIFTDEKVAEFYNANFINAKIDMEKGEGIELAKKYKVQAYPTLLYINKNGEIIHRTCGSAEAEVFIQNGKNALDPENRLAYFEKKYETENSNPEFVYEYITMLRNACMSYENELEKYFANVEKSNLTEKTNWNIINEFLNDPTSETFRYIIDNKSDFYNEFTQDSVDNKIAAVYAEGLNNLIRRKEFESYNKMISELKSSDLPIAEKIVLSSEMFRLRRAKEWEEYKTVAIDYTDKYSLDNANELNSVAWTFYEKFKNENDLKKAEKWARRSVELQDEFYNNDTLAHILFELQKFDEAKNISERAIDHAKKSGADFNETKELLEKINEKI